MLIKFEQNNRSNNNINIAIASSITAYARIHMSQFKNLPGYKLYYSDTDSAYYNKPLPDYLVSNTLLGKMKLESVNSKGIFLAPKVYGLRNTEGVETIKIKGLTHNAVINNNINIECLESLLIKNSVLEANQEKWFKS